MLRERGLVLYLEASVDDILRRVRHDTSRPLLQTGDRRAKIESLLAERAALYRETAHLVFRSQSGNPRRLVETILAHPQLAALRQAGLPPAADGPNGPGGPQS